jgi:hypothetical protein
MKKAESEEKGSLSIRRRSMTKRESSLINKHASNNYRDQEEKDHPIKPLRNFRKPEQDKDSVRIAKRISNLTSKLHSYMQSRE